MVTEKITAVLGAALFASLSVLSTSVVGVALAATL